MKDEDEPLPTASNPMPSVKAKSGVELLMKWTEKKRKLGFGAKGPVLVKDQVPLVEEVAAELSALLIPAKRAAIIRMIEELSWHYPMYPRPEHAVESVARDWAADLRQFPPDIIRAACIEWRRSPATSAPTPGQLLEIARPILAARQFWHAQAVEALAPFAPVGSVSAGGVDGEPTAISAGGVSKLRRGA